jgi:hypothetical protein
MAIRQVVDKVGEKGEYMTGNRIDSIPLYAGGNEPLWVERGFEGRGATSLGPMADVFRPA